MKQVYCITMLYFLYWLRNQYIFVRLAIKHFP